MKIEIKELIKADLVTVWSAWNTPSAINQWNAASDDWHTIDSVVDLRTGGLFSYRMQAKDGSLGFDFEGTYTNIEKHKLIEYVLENSRTVLVAFEVIDDGVKLTEMFDVEDQYSAEQQRQGWQNILERFKEYVEAKV